MGGSGQKEQLPHWAQRESLAGLEVEGAREAQLTINEVAGVSDGAGPVGPTADRCVERWAGPRLLTHTNAVCNRLRAANIQIVSQNAFSAPSLHHVYQGKKKKKCRKNLKVQKEKKNMTSVRHTKPIQEKTQRCLNSDL